MDKASRMTLTLGAAGIINDERFCIKNCGSTVVCVCKNCMEELGEKLKVYAASFEELPVAD